MTENRIQEYQSAVIARSRLASAAIADPSNLGLRRAYHEALSAEASLALALYRDAGQEIEQLEAA